jgi:hypothetical protein
VRPRSTHELASGVTHPKMKARCSAVASQLPTLWNWTRKGKVSSIKLGRRVYYRYDKIVNFILIKAKK